MLYVLVHTPDMGKRKAWFIAPIDKSYCIVVFKNNSDFAFRTVRIDLVYLDIERENPVEPDVDNARTINLKLKNRQRK